MKIVLNYIIPVLIVLGICVFYYYYGNPYAEVIKTISSALSVYTLIMAFLAGRELLKYKGKMCKNISYRNALVELKEIQETLEYNKGDAEKIDGMRTSMISDIISLFEDLFLYDTVLKENFLHKFKFIKEQKKIDVSNICKVIKIIEDIYKSAEKIHE